MNLDFTLILTVLTFTGAIIWLIDSALFRRSRQQRAAQQGNEEISDPVLVDWARSLVPVLLIVLVFRSFLFEPFKIPSGSMIPSLLIGDFIVVNKFSYGLRWPVLNKKFIAIGEPERGDVVVFRKPGDEGVNYIKRVIGKPGDSVVYRDKKLFVNGTAMESSFATRYTAAQTKCGRPRSGEQLFREQLDGRNHPILLRPDYNNRRAESWTVPAGQYFVMGDNRDNSNDSRMWGFVPATHLVGKAVRIWLNFDYEHACADWGRVGARIE